MINSSTTSRPFFSLDCCGHLCPAPILMTEEKMADLKKGDMLEVVFTDPGAKPDLEMWCRATGNEFIRYQKKEAKHWATICKTG